MARCPEDMTDETLAKVLRGAGYSHPGRIGDLMKEASVRIRAGLNAQPTHADEQGRRICSTCGTQVEVVSGDEGTSYYRPAGRREGGEAPLEEEGL